MKMKKVFAVTLASMMFTTPLLAQPINLNGIVTQVDSEIIQDTTVVAVRQLADLLKIHLQYDASTKMVEIIENDVHIKLDLATSMISINEGIPTKVICTVKNGRTYLPLRVIGEALDFNIGFSNGMASVNLKSTSSSPITNSTAENEYHLMCEPYIITNYLYSYFMDIYEKGIGEYVDLVDVAGSTWGALVEYKETHTLPEYLQKEIEKMEAFSGEVESLSRSMGATPESVLALCQYSGSWYTRSYAHNCTDASCNLYDEITTKWKAIYLDWVPSDVNWTVS